MRGCLRSVQRSLGSTPSVHIAVVLTAESDPVVRTCHGFFVRHLSTDVRIVSTLDCHDRCSREPSCACGPLPWAADAHPAVIFSTPAPRAVRFCPPVRPGEGDTASHCGCGVRFPGDEHRSTCTCPASRPQRSPAAAVLSRAAWSISERVPGRCSGPCGDRPLLGRSRVLAAFLPKPVTHQVTNGLCGKAIQTFMEGMENVSRSARK